MIVKRHGGFMELIPSPAEKKRAMVGDNVLDLLSNLNQRLARIEERLGWEATDKTDFADRLARIERDLLENERLNADLASQGMVHPPDSEAPQSA
jgi:hypothetical protein